MPDPNNLENKDTGAAGAAPAGEGSILSEAGKGTGAESKAAGAEGAEGASVLAQAGKEVPVETPGQQAENKRLRDTADDQLGAEDLKKKQDLLKADGEKATKAAQEALKKNVPETYAEFTLPAGFEMNKPLLEKAIPLFKESFLDQVKAQKFIDLFAESVKAIEEQKQAEFKKTVAEGKKETLDALGANATQELAFVAKARDKFFSKETQELLDVSGVGNMLCFIKDTINIGKLISEDKFPGGGGGGGEVPREDRIYQKP